MGKFLQDGAVAMAGVTAVVCVVVMLGLAFTANLIG